MPERRDFFGRTESELVGEIARRKRVLAVAEVYRGNEGLALKLETMRSNIRVYERCLAWLRGERVSYPDGEEPRPMLSGQALEKWRREIMAMARFSRA